MLSRRNMIKLGTLGGLAAVVPIRAAMSPSERVLELTRGAHGAHAHGATLVSAGVAPTVTPFTRALLIPPVLSPLLSTLTTDYYRMTIRPAQVEIFPGFRTDVLSYGGQFTGPTIRARAGRKIVITQTNGMSDPTAVHLHGGHVPPESDGHPMDTFDPGSSRVYTYPNRQAGATLWYHDHAHHLEAEHVYRGLAGFYTIKDDVEDRLRLPSGAHDVPLMFRDAQFDELGQLVYAMGGFRDRKTVLVNGRAQPFFRVKRRKYRFRLLNTCLDRDLNLTLGADGELVQIASDGGLLPAPVPATSVAVWPGERVEVVVDFTRYATGTQVVLVNDRGSEDSTRNVLRFDVVGDADDDESVIPATLRPLPDLGEPTVTRDVSFSMDLATGTFLLDGKTFDPTRVDQNVKLGTTELWRIHNPAGGPPIPHNMHLHLAQFQVVERDGLPVIGHEAGLKDTVTVRSGSNVSFKVRFDGYTGRYVYHCHLLEHSSMAMMAQMEITR
ncbi:multicopper oxidase family protein [Sphaerisporangium corydalis]|uniref:Multicopper oxidase family protein n=1 Tax=Sphaerisporangium corydalis TaxID=1441875 RepID=A0ABV9EF28_9ACTN|nr:multicopper oxidase family protein [Sphaerisporangium corydalis]